MVGHKCTPDHSEPHFYTESEPGLISRFYLQSLTQILFISFTCTPVGTQRGDAFGGSSFLNTILYWPLLPFYKYTFYIFTAYIFG